MIVLLILRLTIVLLVNTLINIILEDDYINY